MVVGFQGECKWQVVRFVRTLLSLKSPMVQGFSAQDFLGRVSKQPYTPEGSHGTCPHGRLEDHVPF